MVAGPDGTLWFTTEREVGRITPLGTFSWFALGTGRDVEGGITLGPDGNLWFTERLVDSIGRLSPTGALTEFALPKAGPYGDKPIAITSGRDGNLWFIENYASTIGRITPSGILTEFALSLPPHALVGSDVLVSITAGPDGAIWFIQQAANEIGRLMF